MTGPYADVAPRIADLPDDREELRADQERLGAEAAGIACANPRVMQARACAAAPVTVLL